MAKKPSAVEETQVVVTEQVAVEPEPELSEQTKAEMAAGREALAARVAAIAAAQKLAQE